MICVRLIAALAIFSTSSWTSDAAPGGIVPVEETAGVSGRIVGVDVSAKLLDAATRRVRHDSRPTRLASNPGDTVAVATCAAWSGQQPLPPRGRGPGSGSGLTVPGTAFPQPRDARGRSCMRPFPILLLLLLAALAAARPAAAQGLERLPLPQLEAERARVAQLMADLDGGNTYIVDPSLRLFGFDDGRTYLDLPVPVDRDELASQLTLALFVLESPDPGFVNDYVRNVMERTRVTRASLPALLAQYDGAIERRRAGRGADLPAAPRGDVRFGPNDPASVEAYLRTSWRLQAQGSSGDRFEANLRVEYVLCGGPDDQLDAVACDFNGLLYFGEQGSVRVERGMYIGGEVRFVVYAEGANIVFEGVLSPQTGEMTGNEIRVAGPAADELAKMGIHSGGSWRAFR